MQVPTRLLYGNGKILMDASTHPQYDVVLVNMSGDLLFVVMTRAD